MALHNPLGPHSRHPEVPASRWFWPATPLMMAKYHIQDRVWKVFAETPQRYSGTLPEGKRSGAADIAGYALDFQDRRCFYYGLREMFFAVYADYPMTGMKAMNRFQDFIGTNEIWQWERDTAKYDVLIITATLMSLDV